MGTSNWDFAIDETITVTAELWATKGSTNTDATNFANYSDLTASPAVGNTFEVYGGGAITKSGKWANGIKSGTLNINNNLERVPKVGSQDVAAIYPQNEDVGCTCAILTDAGGKTDVDDLLTPDETDIVFSSGTTASQSLKWTLTNPSYNRQPLVYRVDMSHMVIDADIGAEAIALAAYS